MAWVPDATKRFRRRPHYEPKELDHECEALTAGFLTRHRGRVEYPLRTDDLTVMVERYVEALDLYADLSVEGGDVEGVTRFCLGDVPSVEVSERLSTDPRRENRLRTTLAHELGHVRFHDPLFQRAFSPGDLFDGRREAKVVCKRDAILGAAQTDWMEWQAGYASGAFLMPLGALNEFLKPLVAEASGLPPFLAGDEIADRLVGAVASRFQVSWDAATVRLLKLAYLSRQPRQPTLFG